MLLISHRFNSRNTYRSTSWRVARHDPRNDHHNEDAQRHLWREDWCVKKVDRLAHNGHLANVVSGHEVVAQSVRQRKSGSTIFAQMFTLHFVSIP